MTAAQVYIHLGNECPFLLNLRFLNVLSCWACSGFCMAAALNLQGHWVAGESVLGDFIFKPFLCPPGFWALVCSSPQGLKQSDMTEWLNSKVEDARGKYRGGYWMLIQEKQTLRLFSYPRFRISFFYSAFSFGWLGLLWMGGGML